MKRFYLDTNVFLARYAPSEKEHDSSTRLLNAVEDGGIRAITSPLTLVEIASVVRRSHEKFAEKMSPADAAGAFVRRALSLKNLSFVPIGGEMTLKGSMPPVRVPMLYTAAFRAVRSLPLKALDLLHIASAYVAVRLFGEELDYFTTLDEGIVDQAKQVREFLGSPAVTPSETVRLEGL